MIRSYRQRDDLIITEVQKDYLTFSEVQKAHLIISQVQKGYLVISQGQKGLSHSPRPYSDKFCRGRICGVYLNAVDNA